MDQRFTYSEQADLYLKGKLSESERAAFEEKIQQDPLLQSEMKLQQEIYQAIGETRKAGIKARLDQLPIEQSPWFIGSTFRMAAVVSAIVVTSVATYLALNPSDFVIPYEVDVTESSRSDYIAKTQEADMKAPEPVIVPEPSADVEAEETTTTSEENASATSPSTITKKEAREAPIVRRPSVTSNFSEDDVQLDYSDFEAPQKQAMQASALNDVNIAIEQVVDTVYPFHYQFYDGKLFLHGDFQSNPYKVIALNTENDRKLFLEHTDHYYQLKEQEDISPLVPIKDTSLIQNLRRLSDASYQ